jgi:glucan phosphoethanolaminetransferase (alkaline phosphatase superfamily)
MLPVHGGNLDGLLLMKLAIVTGPALVGFLAAAEFAAVRKMRRLRMLWNLLAALSLSVMSVLILAALALWSFTGFV